MTTAHAGMTLPRDGRAGFAQGIWRLVDPKIALASVVPFTIGASLAHMYGATIDPAIAAGACGALFFVAVARNAMSELVERRRGAASASGSLSERDLMAIAWISMLLAGVLGLAVASITRPALLILGAAAAGVAAIDSLPPFKLSDRGLGETAVFLTYGPGIVIGTVLLFGAPVTFDVVAISVSLGLMIANVRFISEVPDESADLSAGKRTLVVRLGRDRATTMLGVIFVAAFVIPIIGFATGGSVVLLGLLAGAIPADYAVWFLHQEHAKPPVLSQKAALVGVSAAGGGVMLMSWLTGALS